MESTKAPPGVLDDVPVFAMPQAVLFPGVILPLHIFEPTYCAMVKDTLSSHALLVVSMVRPGDEAALLPALCDIGCLGRIVQVEQLPDGRYNILVHGLTRVRLLEEHQVTGRLYRRFRAHEVPGPGAAALTRAKPILARMQRFVWSLGQAAKDCDRSLVEVLRSRADPLELGDLLGAILVRGYEAQQTVLATEDLGQRIAVVIDSMAYTMAAMGTAPTCERRNQN